MSDREAIKRARNEYARRYRKEHPERVKAAQEAYWLRQAAKKNEDALSSEDLERGDSSATKD